MKKYLVFTILILSILSMNFVLASTIEDTTIQIKMYNTTLEFKNSQYSGNDKTEIINMTNGTINLQEFSFPIIFIRNESVDSSLVDKYAECIELKGKCDGERNQFNMGWNNCLKDLNDYKLNNNESIKEKFNSCNLEKQSLQINLDAQVKKYSDYEELQKDKGNSKYIYGVVGFILGIVGTLFYQGKIGNQNKDKSHEEFNPQRAV